MATHLLEARRDFINIKILGAAGRGGQKGSSPGQPSAASGTGCGLGTGEAQRGSESLWSKSRQSWRAQVTLRRAGKQR